MDGYAWEVPDLSLFDKLDKLRRVVGSITLTSGYRTEKFNKSVGGSSNSYHLQGLAVDCRFDFEPYSVNELKSLFVNLGFTNIGFYMRRNKLDRVHLDIGKTWNDKSHYVFYKEV